MKAITKLLRHPSVSTAQVTRELGDDVSVLVNASSYRFNVLWHTDHVDRSGAQKFLLLSNKERLECFRSHRPCDVIKKNVPVVMRILSESEDYTSAL